MPTRSRHCKVERVLDATGKLGRLNKRRSQVRRTAYLSFTNWPASDGKENMFLLFRVGVKGFLFAQEERRNSGNFCVLLSVVMKGLFWWLSHLAFSYMIARILFSNSFWSLCLGLEHKWLLYSPRRLGLSPRLGMNTLRCLHIRKCVNGHSFSSSSKKTDYWESVFLLFTVPMRVQFMPETMF